jgi:rifampicin phosphotransferase
VDARHDPPAEPPLVLPLAAIDAGMVDLAGGKAANLGELTRAGLPVPPGFCVTTAAYSLAAAGAELAPILHELAALPAEAGDRAAPLAAAARARLHEAPVPAAVTEAILRAYADLGDEPIPVAVRSSATTEDLPFASFAGQHDTYLNVVGPDRVLDAVRRCWASLWTDRAVSYRTSNDIDHGGARLAVVVQRMVAAEVSGVMFTADPVTGRRRQTVIDASRGLGEAVVSGAVNPDHFVIDTATGRTLQQQLGDKRLLIRASAGGGTERVELPPGSGEACLSGEQLRALTQLGAAAEAHYGAPQDTEWAIDTGGALWLTQARPITTLYPLPPGAPAPDQGLRVYFCASLAQGLHRPLTPMGLAIFPLMGSSMARLAGVRLPDVLAGPALVTQAGLRLFFDATAILRSRAGSVIAPRVLDFMEARSATVIRRLAQDPRWAVNHSSRPFVLRAVRVLTRTGAPLRALEAVVRPAAARARVWRLEDGIVAATTPPPGASGADRLLLAQEAVVQRGAPVLIRTVPVVAPGFLALLLARKLLGDDVTTDELQAVLRGLPHNPTTDMDLRLWELAERIRQDPSAKQVLDGDPPERLTERYLAGALPPVAQDGLARFLASYGHRAVAEIDIGLPRWSEDPAHLLAVLANYLRLDDRTLAPDAQFRRAAADAEATIAELVGRAARRGRLRARLVGLALDRTRQLTGFREMPKYLLVVLLAGVRELLWSVGEELARAGRIEQTGDVFFLDMRETGQALAGEDVRERIGSRKATYALELRRRHVPRIMLSDGTEPEAEVAAPAGPVPGGLSGTPASAGTVTARARVVLDPVGARLEPGEILVAPSTDPGWTPLFLTAGGLVMEMGGANSHGAVVAREYGIPAVVGVAAASERIRTGQVITVDGSAGTVALDAAEPLQAR